MAGVPWGAKEKEILRAMALAGKTVKDIQRVIKRSRPAICSQAYQDGLSLAGAEPEIDMAAFNEIMGGEWKQPAQE